MSCPFKRDSVPGSGRRRRRNTWEGLFKGGGRFILSKGGRDIFTRLSAREGVRERTLMSK